MMRNRYSHARQMRRSRREEKKLKVYLGRVIRDVKRKIAGDDSLVEKFSETLALAERVYQQQRGDQKKLYSLHAPEVECLARGKAHRKYEFGCKVSLVATSRDNFLVGIQALHGSPYDGHTLTAALAQAERLAGFQAQEVYVDRGYRGHTYRGPAVVHLARSGTRKLKRSLRYWLKRRSAIEPLIGHAKNDGRLGRNYLSGVEGDRINALLAGCGYNIRKLLRQLLFWLFSRWPSYKIEVTNSALPVTILT
jgi:IS5 family transposase